MPKCTAPSFHRQVQQIPEALSSALTPVMGIIRMLSDQIRQLDRKVEGLCRQGYPETARLRQVAGVGPLTALTFVLTLEDPSRFARARAVGPYLGLTRKKRDSGEQSPQLRISKAGDGMVRQLLVGSGQYILGPFGPDCDLRRWGLKLAERGGKNAKKRAVVAVARKLGVLLYRLWVSDEVYEPLRNSQARSAVPAANNGALGQGAAAA